MRDDKPKGDVSPRVLVVEDEENVRDLLLEVLAENGYRVEAVRTGEEGLRQLDSQLYDLVLLDLNLPGMHGLNVLGAGPALQTDAQFIVMTAFGSIDSAVEAMKLGAVDFIKKPFRTEELLHVLTRAMEELELKREVAQLRSQSSAGVRSYLVGKSQAMQRVFGLIERVAPTRANVLIGGDTGTGKELVARAVHDLSGRSRRPFVAINCSALPETLLESELFGHMKGSFTGAVQSKRGLFEEAQGGSIFLDEISTVSEGVQIKLLRVLQDRKVTRVGGREPITVDFRLIAATNRDLGELVEAGE
ncbi:MAG: sigma-54 dependent transcriptional regulator, partial [marine benthic group bacterium]|nr:sigma-54 dependent transcriptional regulator [Gemmatimonadota bacterium]